MPETNTAEDAKEKLRLAFVNAHQNGYRVTKTGVDLRQLGYTSDLASRAVEAILDSELPDEAHIDYEKIVEPNALANTIDRQTQRNRT